MHLAQMLKLFKETVFTHELSKNNSVYFLLKYFTSSGSVGWFEPGVWPIDWGGSHWSLQVSLCVFCSQNSQRLESLPSFPTDPCIPSFFVDSPEPKSVIKEIFVFKRGILLGVWMDLLYSWFSSWSSSEISPRLLWGEDEWEWGILQPGVFVSPLLWGLKYQLTLSANKKIHEYKA